MYSGNESTAGADASVEALKPYYMKPLTLDYLAKSIASSSLNLQKVGNDRP